MQRYVDFQSIPRNSSDSYPTCCDNPINLRQNEVMTLFCVVKSNKLGHPEHLLGIPSPLSFRSPFCHIGRKSSDRLCRLARPRNLMRSLHALRLVEMIRVPFAYSKYKFAYFFVPKKGIFCSQCGNISVPTWEYLTSYAVFRLLRLFALQFITFYQSKSNELKCVS